MKLKIFTLFWILPSLLAPMAWAKDRAETLVHVQVQATRHIENDELQATIFTEAQHNSRIELAKRLNLAVKNTLAVTKNFPQIIVETQQHDIYPIYDNQKLRAWRGRAALNLRSQDSEAVTKLVAQISKDMQMSDIQFGISPHKREQIETELIHEASHKLQQRAQVLSKALQKRHYRIVDMTLNHAQPHQVRAMPMMARAAKDAEADLMPEFSAGEGEVRLHIHATLALDD